MPMRTMPNVKPRQANNGLTIDPASLWALKKVPSLCLLVLHLAPNENTQIWHAVIRCGFASPTYHCATPTWKTKGLLVPSPVTPGLEQTTTKTQWPPSQQRPLSIQRLNIMPGQGGHTSLYPIQLSLLDWGRSEYRPLWLWGPSWPSCWVGTCPLIQALAQQVHQIPFRSPTATCALSFIVSF